MFSFYIDHTILNKLFELCPFMHLTVAPHENHADGFFLTHIQSQQIINFDIFFPTRVAPHSGLFCYPLYFTLKRGLSMTSILVNASNNIFHSVNRKRACYLPNEAFCEPKSDKMDKRGAILIIIVECYSIPMYLFGFIFTVL